MQRPAGRRRLAVLGLAVVVLLAHLWLSRSIADSLAELSDNDPMPERLQAVYTRQLMPTEPVPVVAQAAAPPPAAAALPVEGPASQPPPKVRKPPPPKPVKRELPKPAPVEPPASQPEADILIADAASTAPSAASQASVGDAPASEPSLAAASQSAASSPASSAPAASAPAFEWPASTRLSYVLNGNFRGPVQGSAQVEWLRDGERYQVHLDVIAGLRIAPLFTRRITSDGLITAEGLAPRRFDEETRRAFADRRHVSIVLDEHQVTLANGQQLPRPPGVQDSASQFVQMLWMFSLHPELLRIGNRIEIPLALPRSLDVWAFDVLEPETLYTPFGAINSVHLKPNRPARPGELSVEIWFAPSLQYLPARILIHQDASTFIDLTLERLPEQAAKP